MSAKSKDRNKAIAIFTIIFLLWISLSYTNYKLSAENAKNISIIAKQLQIDIIEIND